MLEPVAMTASLAEDGFPVDKDSYAVGAGLTYLGMSGSGDVTADVIYAHSGNPEDYDWLVSQGIDPRGKIAVVRYSNPYSYRGFKAWEAERRGVAALIIYSDPMDDGYRKGDVFPRGPWGPESHIQRGAITYDFIVPGDPLTPGWASIEGARRITQEEARSVPQIPAVPMSWGDAKPILEKPRRAGRAALLAGCAADHVSRRPGPGEAPRRGRHGRRDAADLGGRRPDSRVGETGRDGHPRQPPRRLGVRRGRPVERHRHPARSGAGARHARARRRAAAAHPGLRQLGRRGVAPDGLDGVGRAVRRRARQGRRRLPQRRQLDERPELREPAPSPASTRRSSRSRATSSTPTAAAASSRRGRKRRRRRRETTAIASGSLVENDLGSGSDYTVFLNFLGVPVVDLTFDGPYGVYHSQYDDLYWMEHFGDPGYRYMTAMAEVWGRLGLRLANADVHAYDYRQYATTVRRLRGFPARGSRTSRGARPDRGRGRGRRVARRGGEPAAEDRPRPDHRERTGGGVALEPQHRPARRRARAPAGGRDPRPTVVQTQPVRTALHLRGDVAAGGSRGGGSGRTGTSPVVSSTPWSSACRRRPQPPGAPPPWCRRHEAAEGRRDGPQNPSGRSPPRDWSAASVAGTPPFSPSARSSAPGSSSPPPTSPASCPTRA